MRDKSDVSANTPFFSLSQPPLVPLCCPSTWDGASFFFVSLFGEYVPSVFFSLVLASLGGEPEVEWRSLSCVCVCMCVRAVSLCEYFLV